MSRLQAFFDEVAVRSEGFRLKLAKATCFGTMDRIEMYERFEAFVRAQQPITAILKALLGRMSKRSLLFGAEFLPALPHPAWDKVMRDQLVLRFNEALAPFIPSAERAMIRVGESSGDYAMGFAEARFVAEASAEIRGALFGALLYPVILSLFAVVLIVAIGIEIGPQITVMLDRPRDEWPFSSLALVSIGDLVLGWGWLLGVLGLMVGGWLVWALPRWTVRAPKLRLFLDQHVPPFTIYREYQASSFLIALGALLRAQRPLNAALSDIAEISVPWLRAHVQTMHANVMAAKPFGEALETGLLAQAVVDYLKDFDAMGTFEQGMETVGRRGIKQSIGRVKKQAGFLRNLGLIAVVTLMGLIYAGVMQPGIMMYQETTRGVGQ
jgi:type II secretory pathway component PulF